MAARQLYGVRSPQKNIPLSKLKALKRDNFHNPSTGLELSESETNERINELEQSSADKKLSRQLKVLNRTGKKRSQGRAWIPKGEVVFRRINGKNVPFKKRDRPEDFFE